MSEWKTYKLGDFAEINPKISLKQESEYSFVEMKDLDATFKYVSPSTKKELKGGAKFRNGDTLFARITPCLENGKICQVKNLDNNVGFGSTEFLVFRGKENISNSDFVYYLSRSEFVKNNAIQMMTGTSGRQRVEKSALEKLEITVPDLSSQIQIAQVLTSLDDKIEFNLQMNQTLEAMAQALFKEWFVSFKFPGFDGGFKNGLPKGWRKIKIIELFDVTDYVANGSFASLAENVQYKNEPDFAVLIRLTDYNRDYNGNFVYLNEHSYNFLNKSKLFGDEIIIANVGANAGDVFRAPYLDKPMSLGPNAIMIKNNVASNYLYSYLTSELGQYALKSIIAGSAQPKFNKTDFRKLELIFPDEITLQQYNDFYNPINEKLLSNKSQIKTLTQTRDTLLPKLMSGEIQIKN